MTLITGKYLVVAKIPNKLQELDTGGYVRLLTFIPKTLVVVLIAVDCSDDNSTSPGKVDGNVTLKMYMTDAPGDYEAVNVTISSVSMHYADGVEEPEVEEDSGDEAAPAKQAALMVHGSKLQPAP